VTVTENTEIAAEATSENTASPSEAPTVVNATYKDLAFATWKLTYHLCYDEDAFCADGANEYLRRFNLPELVHVDGNHELMDKYLNAWYSFTHWNVADETDNTWMRDRLARTIRADLQRNEPKSRATMNQWLTELGIEEIPEPRPEHRHARYRVSTRGDVNSAMIAEALNAKYPELDVQVAYEGNRF